MKKFKEVSKLYSAEFLRNKINFANSIGPKKTKKFKGGFKKKVFFMSS